MDDPFAADREHTRKKFGGDPYDADRTPQQRARAVVDKRANASPYNAGDSTLTGQFGNLARAAIQPFGAEIAGGIEAGVTGAQNLAARFGVGKPAGYGMGDAFAAGEGRIRDDDAKFAKAHPFVHGLAQVTAGAALPGVGIAARGAAAGGMAAVRGAALEAGAVGGAYGYASGTGNPVQRAPGTAVGVGLGVAAGAGLQTLGGALASRAAARTPTSLASKRAARLISDDAPQQVQRYADAGITPTVADVGGDKFRRTMRGMGVTPGQASDDLVSHAQTTVTDMKPGAMNAARNLSPYDGTASQLSDQLATTQRTAANRDYAPAYAEPVTLTPEAISALRGEHGQAAIAQAMRGASANQDHQLMTELHSLSVADLDNPPQVSGAALDRVRMAMRDIGTSFTRGDSPDRYTAAGYAGRVGGIDTALDSAPGLTDARATYRSLQGARDVLDKGDSPDLLTTDPRDYADYLAGLSAPQRAALQVGERGNLMDKLGGQRASTTGTLDTLSTSGYGRPNVEALYGDRGSQFLNNTDARLNQVSNARMMSPNAGSRTAYVAGDNAGMGAADMLGIAKEGLGAVKGNVLDAAKLFDRVRTAGIGQPERDAFVQLGLSKVGSPEELQKVLNISDQAAQIGRQAPKRVRDYVSRAKGVLGPTSPLATQLEQRLLQGPGSGSGVANDGPQS